MNLSVRFLSTKSTTSTTNTTNTTHGMQVIARPDSITLVFSQTSILPGLHDEICAGEANVHDSWQCWHGPVVHSPPFPFAGISTLLSARSRGNFRTLPAQPIKSTGLIGRRKKQGRSLAACCWFCRPAQSSISVRRSRDQTCRQALKERPDWTTHLSPG